MFTKVSDLLEPTLEKLDLSKKAKKYMVFHFWEEVVGKKINQHSRPAFFKGSNLFVSVKNSSWIQELTFLKSSVKEKLNEKLGENLIKDIFFINKPFKTTTKDQSYSEDDFPGLAMLELEPKQKDKIEETLKNISDSKLKETLKRILYKETLIHAWKIQHGWKCCLKCNTLIEKGNFCEICKKA